VWALSDLAELPAPDLRKPDIPRITPGMHPQYAQLRPLSQEPIPETSAPTRPAPPTPPQPSSIPVPAIVSVLGLGLLLLRQQLIDEDSDDEHLIVGVRSRVFRRGERHVEFGSERKLSQEEVEEYCPDIKVVQKAVDLARDNIGSPDNFGSRDAYGRAIDREFKRILRKINQARLKNGNSESRSGKFLSRMNRM
jgi:hypothetical protein